MGIMTEFRDADYADLDCASDLTDTECDDGCACVAGAFGGAGSRCCKRTCGGVGDGRGVPERRRKRSRINEQLEHLRDVVPNLCTNDKALILAGAYEYIEKLQRHVQELQSELDTDSPCSDDGDTSSCEDDGERPNAASEAGLAECRSCSHPTVEVERTEEGLKIHIRCEKKPQLLAHIMEMLELSGMAIDQVVIVYHEDSQFEFDCVGSEVDGKDVADSKFVEARLRALIADH